MANELDDRGRRLFALMWTDQPGERAAACNAFVAHCKRIGLHPADAFPGTHAREAASAPRVSTAKHEAVIRELTLAIKRKSAAIARHEDLVSRLTRALSAAEAEIDRLRASQQPAMRAASRWPGLTPTRDGRGWLSSLARRLSDAAARLTRGRPAQARPDPLTDGRSARAAERRFRPTR
jgi:hypothetical protein